MITRKVETTQTLYWVDLEKGEMCEAYEACEDCARLAQRVIALTEQLAQAKKELIGVQPDICNKIRQERDAAIRVRDEAQSELAAVKLMSPNFAARSDLLRLESGWDACLVQRNAAAARADKAETELRNVRNRLQQFESAAQYDSERDNPAGEEARAVWASILDKPHYALPEIQVLITARDAALAEVESARVKVSELRNELEKTEALLEKAEAALARHRAFVEAWDIMQATSNPATPRGTMNHDRLRAGVLDARRKIDWPTISTTDKATT